MKISTRSRKLLWPTVLGIFRVKAIELVEYPCHEVVDLGPKPRPPLRGQPYNGGLMWLLFVIEDCHYNFKDRK